MHRLIILAFVSVATVGLSQNTSKPWTYWWWMGSAVDEKNIEIQLKQFSAAGLGGVHIIPIYGVKGYEDRFNPFLSKRWIQLLDYTVSVARREGLGVDLTTGTGWPFGGPNITSAETSKKLVASGSSYSVEPVGQKVKRAAPGGAGLVVDPFSRSAMNKYLQRFDSVFSKSTHGVRSMYCDSYEVYGANSTDRFEEEFERRRGYRLQERLRALTDTTGGRESVLIRIDYHQTIAELLHETMQVWSKWSASRNFTTRYQAHGSPGNLLDLYGLASIPETESFGSGNFPIPKLRIDATYDERNFGRPSSLAMKFASSAANVTGNKLISSETGTWLADHFTVALSQVKPQVDELFASGINHIFYHGIPYSPAEEKYPGWLFYASTNFGPTSAFWKYLPELNSYIERCQALLQESKPDNDVLLYFPIADIWSKQGRSAGNVHQLDVHHTERWLTDTPFGKTAQSMADNGFAFDYVSDRQLTEFSVNGTDLTNGVARYRVLVVPSCQYIPRETLERIAGLASNGARVFFIEHLPKSATGFFQTRSKNEQLDLIRNSIARLENVSIVKSLVEINGIRREEWATHDVRFIRKRTRDGIAYFVTNLGARRFDQLIKPSNTASGYTIFNPLTNKTYTLVANSNGEIPLTLEPGESCFLLSGGKTTQQNQITYGSVSLDGPWNVQLDEGNPSIQLSRRNVHVLDSWTTWCDSCQYFSGIVRYGKTFDLPKDAEVKSDFSISFEDVKDVAAVIINDKNIGVAWSIPYRVTFPGSLLKRTDNNLEIRVSNASSNYFRLYDQRHPEWKKFYDINFVNIEYKPYDGAKVTTMDAGLLGAVSLQYRKISNNK